MTLATGLIERIRYEFLADDAAIDPADNWWSDTNICNALNESQREIARRCLLIQDSVTPGICFLPFTAGQQTLPLSSKILRIRFVLFPHLSSIVGHARELLRTSTEYLNERHQGHTWIGRRGRVELFVTDFQAQSLTFGRAPEYGGTVQIGVIRLPLTDMTILDPQSAPEIQERDLALIHGALKCLYSKGYAIEDQESYNPIKEARWRKEFEADIQLITQDLAAMQPKLTVCRPGEW